MTDRRRAAGEIPAHLRDFADVYRRSPREASLEWFQDARFGLFIHYGLYSLLGRGEWVMYNEQIPVAEYEKLKENFRAEAFDAEAIADLAVEAGMRYINFTTRHHDSFSLFRTTESDFSSVDSPAGRDLVAELAAACEKRGLGLFLYYSYGADWRHPYFLSNEIGVPCSRPDYAMPDPSYLLETENDFSRYLSFMEAQLHELFTQYGSIAGVWFDLVTPCYHRPDLFPVEDSYRLVRELQSHALVAFKQGVSGSEDFMAQEMSFVPLEPRLRAGGADDSAIARSLAVWQQHQGKWNEVCTIMQDKGWGYRQDAIHVDADEVWARLGYARANRCNLLLNTGLLPDGSVHPQDRATLLKVGDRIGREGYPVNGEIIRGSDTGAGAI